MARRSSRLRNRNSSTPQRDVTFEDASSHITHSVPAKLTIVHEGDEMPGAFPRSVSPELRMGSAQVEAGHADATTPSQNTPIKPSALEMHPQLHQRSTAKLLEEARHLGFSNMGANTAPTTYKSKVAQLQETPSRANPSGDETSSATFQFTFHREHSLELSPEAKKLMFEKREEAAKIREQMVADGEALQNGDEIVQRKIAVPKGKKGRYSRAHMDEFEKMNSIANHASAFRADPNWQRSTPSTPQKSSTPYKTGIGTAQSLKRSSSKAGLDQGDRESKGSKPPSYSSANQQQSRTSGDQGAASKRIKLTVDEEASSTNGVSDNGIACDPRTTPSKSVPPTKPTPPSKPAPPSKPTSPSKSSRPVQVGSTVKQHTSTTRIPAPCFTPTKNTNTVDEANKGNVDIARLNCPLSTVTDGDDTIVAQGNPSKCALLARTPTKASAAKISAKSHQSPGVDAIRASPLLARSPSRPIVHKKTSTNEMGELNSKVPSLPLLAQSPTKAPILPAIPGATSEKTISTPLLSRSPSKIHLSDTNNDAQKPGHSGSNKLVGRFNLLRQSPMKSILRSPQRFYSDDPAKIAAGTHLATPPQHARAHYASGGGPATVSAQKHVDFSSSTKARDEASSKASSETPSKTPGPSSIRAGRQVTTPSEPAEAVTYPALPSDESILSPSPAKRRQTAGPGDFTFRAGDQTIKFAPSPNAPRAAATGTAQTPQPPTIRYVSSDHVPPPATGSKKRKFDFENNRVEDDGGSLSDKENASSSSPSSSSAGGKQDDRPRPAKRAKMDPRPVQSSPAKKPPRKPTLGVRPLSTVRQTATSPAKQPSFPKRPTTISQARLNALAQPKRRA